MRAKTTLAQTEQIQIRLQSAISAIHAIQWASLKANGSDDIDGLISLLDTLIPVVGAELEAVHVALGGTPLGRFAQRAGGMA